MREPIPELGSETPIKGKRYKWNDIGRRKYDAIFIEMDNGTAIMRMDNGDLKRFDLPGK